MLYSVRYISGLTTYSLKLKIFGYHKLRELTGKKLYNLIKNSEFEINAVTLKFDIKIIVFYSVVFNRLFIKNIL